MKCPECGYESPIISIDYGKKYRQAVESRLVNYGYPEQMNPQKHQAATAIRKVISIRYGVKCKAGGGMVESEAKKAIAAINEVLPPKGAKE